MVKARTMKRPFHALYLLPSLVPSLYSGSFNHFWTPANKQDLLKPSLSKGRFLSVTRPKLFHPALLLGQFGNTDLVPALMLQKSMCVLTLTLWR